MGKKKVRIITFNEFNDNDEKYLKLAKTEIIKITVNGDLFMILNKKTVKEINRRKRLIASIQDILPPNVKFGKELDAAK